MVIVANKLLTKLFFSKPPIESLVTEILREICTQFSVLCVTTSRKGKLGGDESAKKRDLSV